MNEYGQTLTFDLRIQLMNSCDQFLLIMVLNKPFMMTCSKVMIAFEPQTDQTQFKTAFAFEKENSYQLLSK